MTDYNDVSGKFIEINLKENDTMFSQKKLTERVHKLKELERQEQDLHTQIENLKNEIKREMENRGVDQLIGEDWQVSWTQVTTNRFNQSAFKKEHPHLFESFVAPSFSRRFTVK